MGMAASQARFLSLVARKNNVEYEGQQINQQRTALSNASASYYSDLLGMAVPVCPSVEDFTQTVYSFTDGALTNSITSLIAQGDGTYKASYLCSYVDDFAIVAAGATSIVNTASGDYMVGADKLKVLAEDMNYSYIIKEGFSEYRLTQRGNNYTYTDILNQLKTLIPATIDVVETVVGPMPKQDNYSLDPLINHYREIACYENLINSGSASDKAFHLEHNLCLLMWSDGRDTITSSKGVVLKKKIDGYSLAGYDQSNVYDPGSHRLQDVLSNSFPDIYQHLVDLYIDNIAYMKHKNLSVLPNDAYEFGPDLSGLRIRNFNDIYTEWEYLWHEISNLNYLDVYQKDLEKWEQNAAPYLGNYVDSADYTKIYTLSERKMFYDGQDPYLKSLSSDQLENLSETELDLKELLNEKIGEPDSDWYVRYVQNSATGEWEAIFYNGDEIANGIVDEHSNIRSNIQAYKLGSKRVQNEIKGRDAVLEQDSTGRYINISFIGEDNEKTTYALTTSTVTDNDAYNDAMNQYEYDKALYDKNIEEVNAKIAIIQAEDKNLELRLKQLDTEHDALSNEMDAVQKVIEKNVESGFKTFG